MSKVERSPAIARRHPADNLPERPDRQKGSTDDAAESAPASMPAVQAAPAVEPKLASTQEKMTEQHNVRIRPSVKARAVRAVGKLRYETGDRDVSLQSITDAALDEYLTKHGC